MNKKSVIKLQEAGYIFIRERDITGRDGRMIYAIMQSQEFGSWTLLEKFETKAARMRRITELCELDNILY
jgi:hypothetical protein